MDTSRQSYPEPESDTRPTSSVQPLADLPWWRRITVPVEVVIASLVVSAMLLLTVLMVYQVSTSAQRAIIAASDENAQRISQLISERVHRIVDPADTTIRLLAFDPVALAQNLPARLLEQNKLLSAVFIGYPDGQFLLMRPLRDAALRTRLDAPRDAAFLVHTMSRDRGAVAAVGRWNYYDAQLRLIESAVRPEYRYDPRTRPWYAEAAEKNTQILTTPYGCGATTQKSVCRHRNRMRWMWVRFWRR